MRAWCILPLVLAGCTEPPEATGACADHQGPGDLLLVEFLPPDEEVYDAWTQPDWSAYEVSVERHASNGDSLWRHEGSIVGGCLAAPLDGAGDYRLSATAPVPEDSQCWFTAYEGFQYNGAGVLELERQVGAVCA